MKYCIKCLQPDTRPNTHFDDFGICPACNYFAALSEVDWSERIEILLNLFKKRTRSKSGYDCIIGVSGGKDSTRQALWIRDKLNLKPLLVCLSSPPEQVTERGMFNLSNLINLGFDVVVSYPAPGVWRDLKRDGFEIFTNSFRSTELALFSCVPQVAIKYGIDLVFWGENPALQLGDMNALGKNGYDGNNLRNLNTLVSGKEWMIKKGYSEASLIPYNYPTVTEFEDANLQIIYLGWFLGDWSLVNNAMYSVLNGLKIRSEPVEMTGDLFGVTALDEDFTPINQMIKYYKFGFGRTTDYVNEEIRLGRLSRDEGVEIVKKYDSLCSSEYIAYYCEYLNISVEHFWDKVREAAHPKLFKLDGDGVLKPTFEVGIGH